MDAEANENQEIPVDSMATVHTCTVDTKEIEGSPVVSVSASELEFEPDFTDEHVAVAIESTGKRKLDEDSDENSASKHLHVDLQDSDSYEVESFVAMASDREMTARKVAATQVYSATDLGPEGQLAALSQAISSVDAVPQEQTIVPAVTGNAGIQVGEEDDVNQAWFTTKEDKDSFHTKGVKWRQGMWSKEENELLKYNILNYCKMNNIADPHVIIFEMSKDDRKDFYRTIAKGIKRPLFAIYRRVLRMYDRRNYIGKYSNEEVEQLRILKEKHGNDWATIGAAMGRSASSVKDRFRLMREHCQSGKWTAEEEQRLSSAVRELSNTQPGESVTGGLSWASVAMRVGTRSEKQCRSKWLNYLNWKEQGGQEWTKQDEIQLIKRIYNSAVEDENDINWTALARDWPRYSVRSPQWLRSKWWALKKHIPDESMGFQETLEYLYSTYIDTLQSKLERQEARFRGSRMCASPVSSLPGSPRQMHIPTTVSCASSSSIAHTITVTTDGTITARDEGDLGSDNRYEVVQVNNLPSQDAYQVSTAPHLQQSYIIQTVPHPSAHVAGGNTYTIIQSPTGQFVRPESTTELTQESQSLDGTPVENDQVQISTANVVTVLQANHAVQTLPTENPELSQAIVQTDISGPVTQSHVETHHVSETDIGPNGLSPGEMVTHEGSAGSITGTELMQQDSVYETGQEEMVDSLNGSVLPPVTVVSQNGVHSNQLSSSVTSLQSACSSNELNTDTNILVTGHTDTRCTAVNSLSFITHPGDTHPVAALNVSSIPQMASLLPSATFCLSGTVDHLTSSTMHSTSHGSDLSSNDVMANVALPDQILQSSGDDTCELHSPTSTHSNLHLPVSNPVGIVPRDDSNSTVSIMSGDDGHLGTNENVNSAMENLDVVPLDSVVVVATCEPTTPLLSSSPAFSVSQ